MRIYPFFLVLASFLLAEYVYSASISTTTDRNPVELDASFTLIFEADASPDGEPDFSPLTEALQILGRRKSSSTHIINGKITRSQQWALTVIAKQAGVLSIPAIRFGSDKSKAITVNVVKGQPSTPGRAPAFIELDIDNKAPYVQAQVLFTVRLYLAAAFSSGSLSEPQLDAGTAVVKKIGEDKKYQSQRGQQPYKVVERQYAIYPQKSGMLTIAPILFQGQTGSNSFFSNSFGARTVIKRSDEVVLHVQPIPAAFPGQSWLPATDINITEQWSTDPEQLQQGAPVTRTLTVTAQGLLASQLPEVAAGLAARLKRYPDQPLLSDTSNVHGFLGARTQKWAVVPVDAGTFSLPAVRIPWWNTLTDKLEYAVLPSRELMVRPTSPVTAAPPVQQQDDALVIDTVPHTPRTFWREAFFISLFVWLVSLLLFLSSRIKGMLTSSATSSTQQHKSGAINAFRRACKENNPRAAAQSLLHWGRLHWPQMPATSLVLIGQRCGAELGPLLIQLDQLLYSAQGAHWEGSALLDAFERYLKEKKKGHKANTSALEPLHYI